MPRPPQELPPKSISSVAGRGWQVCSGAGMIGWLKWGLEKAAQGQMA